MDSNVVECDPAERDVCVCKGGPTLAILKEVQRAYEERMALIERVGGANKLQMQVDVLRAWVGDLVGQNTLLARAVEELETEATARLLLERRKHNEIACELRAEAAALRRRLARKHADLRGLVEVLRRLRELDYCTLDGIHFFEVTESDIFGTTEWRQKKLDDGDSRRKVKSDLSRLEGYRHFKWDKKKKICGNAIEMKIHVDSLQKENLAKDREIRRLNKDVQQYEQTIINLRNEMALNKHYNPNVPKKDAEVMAGMCCTGNECGDWEPVRETSLALREESSKCQERMHKMESSLKESSASVRSLRKANAALSSELCDLRRVCAALQQQCRAAALRTQFKEDIIREMRRQLNQAKNKLKEYSESKTFKSDFAECVRAPAYPYDAVTIACVRQQPRRARDPPPRQAERCLSDDGRSPRPDGSGDDVLSSFESCPCVSDSPRTSPRVKQESPGVRIVENSPQAPILVSDASIDERSHPSPRAHSPRQKKEENKREDCRGVEELFFNNSASNASELGKPCANDECEQTLEVKGICSCQLSKEPKSTAKSLPLCKIIQESGGASSFPDTESSSWDAPARAQYYHHKLIATLQVLANKEETVRVQAESLRVAEARIAALSARAEKLRAQLDAKSLERRSRYAATDKVERADAAVAADMQEVQDQKAMVKTLQTNLSVIEDLYRECFYETAKQEELIEMLRKSYLDVRLVDRDKSAQIGKLQSVISNQKWSLQKCQDMSMEVENLKMEISNFLNSSNNDSGVWERAEDPVPSEVLQDLRAITDQLLQLRTMLTGDCTCGLEEETVKLKEVNENLQLSKAEYFLLFKDSAEAAAAPADLEEEETWEGARAQVSSLRHKASELEVAREHAETYREQLSGKEIELAEVKRQLAELRASAGDRDQLAARLRQAQVSLEEQANSLAQARQECGAREETVSKLRRELEAARRDHRESVASAALHDELARALQRCRAVDAAYRESAAVSSQLQAQLEEAQARGAALCADVRRVAAGVARAARRMRQRHRVQENKIKEQESIIKALQFKLSNTEFELPDDRCYHKSVSLASKRSHERVSETTSCGLLVDDDIDIHHTEDRERRDDKRKRDIEYHCSLKNKERRKISVSETGSCLCALKRQDRASTSRNETASCVGARRDERSKTSASEAASCSSAPTPPRRLLKKKFNPSHEPNDETSWWGVRRHTTQRVRVERLPREASPTAELEERVNALQAALQRSQERWTRGQT